MDIEKARLTKNEAYETVAYLFDSYDWESVQVVADAASRKMLRACIAELRKEAHRPHLIKAAFNALLIVAHNWQQALDAADAGANREQTSRRIR